MPKNQPFTDEEKRQLEAKLKKFDKEAIANAARADAYTAADSVIYSLYLLKLFG